MLTKIGWMAIGFLTVVVVTGLLYVLLNVVPPKPPEKVETKPEMSVTRQAYYKKVLEYRKKNPPKNRSMVCGKGWSDYLKGKATIEVLKCE